MVSLAFSSPKGVTVALIHWDLPECPARSDERSRRGHQGLRWLSRRPGLPCSAGCAPAPHRHHSLDTGCGRAPPAGRHPPPRSLSSSSQTNCYLRCGGQHGHPLLPPRATPPSCVRSASRTPSLASPVPGASCSSLLLVLPRFRNLLKRGRSRALFWSLPCDRVQPHHVNTVDRPSPSSVPSTHKANSRRHSAQRDMCKTEHPAFSPGPSSCSRCRPAGSTPPHGYCG